MKSLLVALLMTPFASGAALAARPLADAQMDGVAAGFSARSVADAEGMAGSGGGFLAPAPVQGVSTPPVRRGRSTSSARSTPCPCSKPARAYQREGVATDQR
jgi:hypothetical protein